MSDTLKRTSDESGMPFVDPWVKKPNNQGGVPVNALFVGAWANDVGIDSYSEAFFLLRDDRRDLLWSLATHCEESTKQNLAATPNRYSPTPSSINVASTCSSAPHRC